MRSSFYHSPFHLFLTTLLIIFFAEVVVMHILPLFPKMELTYEAFLDGFMLSLLVFPLMYILSFKPMQEHINERLASENALREMNEKLENLVKDRTLELENANSSLKLEIKEKETAQDESRKHQAYGLRIVESFPDIMFILDLRKKRCIFINSRIKKIGYDPEEIYLMGEKFLENVVKTKSPSFFSVLQYENFKEAGAVVEEKVMLAGPDGKEFLLDMRVTPFEKDSEADTLRYVLCTLPIKTVSK